MSDIQTLRRILVDSRTIAIVGLSRDWFRPSFFAAKYLQERGYTIIPVNPRYEEILGERCYPNLRSVPTRIDVVDVFRRAEDAPQIAREAIEVGARVLWLQLGVVSAEAEALARDAGLTVVMDRCMKIEFARLFGGLGWFGVNTGVLSARRAVLPPRLRRSND